MQRLLSILLVVLFVSAAFVGCFGDDDDHDHDPDPSPSPSPTADNNTTNETNMPPIPVMNVSLEADGEPVAGPPFLVTSGANVNLTLDANASNDPDGEIEAYAWKVTSDAGFKASSTDPVFVAGLGDMSRSGEFGLFHVSLIVYDGEFRTEAVGTFAIDYRSDRQLPEGMTGGGTEARNDAHEGKVADNDVGTFNTHQVTLGENATAINLTLTYASSTTAQMKLFLFDPSVSSDGDTASADPANEEGPGSSPVALTHTEDLTPGTWWIRVELDGVSISSYTLEIVVNYGVGEDDPDDAADDGDEGDEGDDGDEGE